MRAARKFRNVKVIEPAQVQPGQTKVDAFSESPDRSPAKWSEAPAGPPPIKPRGFPGAPTHAIGIVDDRRSHPRAGLSLPLRLKRVAGQREPEPAPVTLVTLNISSSGVFFLCPRSMEPGTALELEVGLVDRPLGRGSVRMTTAAHVVRVEPTGTPGWHGVAVSFDDISFLRDEPIPPRYEQP